MHVVTYSADALREVGDHVVALAEAENLPSHGTAVSIRTSRRRLVMPLPEWVPIRDDLRGFEPYGAPQIPDVINLNVNENPYAPSAQVAADIAEAVRIAATGLNRYPDREATRAAHGAGRTISATD